MSSPNKSPKDTKDQETKEVPGLLKFSEHKTNSTFTPAPHGQKLNPDANSFIPATVPPTSQKTLSFNAPTFQPRTVPRPFYPPSLNPSPPPFMPHSTQSQPLLVQKLKAQSTSGNVFKIFIPFSQRSLRGPAASASLSSTASGAAAGKADGGVVVVEVPAWSQTRKQEDESIVRGLLMMASIPVTAREIQIRMRSLISSLSAGKSKAKSEQEKAKDRQRIQNINKLVYNTNPDRQVYSYVDMLRFQNVSTEPPAEFNADAVPKISTDIFFKNKQSLQSSQDAPASKEQEGEQGEEAKKPTARERNRITKTQLAAMNTAHRLIMEQASTPAAHKKKALATLNKIAPSTFEALLPELFNHLITRDILQEVINALYEKAVFETKYVSMYAELCHRISELENWLGSNWDSNGAILSSADGAASSTSNKNQQEFRELLMARCLQQFHHDRTLTLTPEQRAKMTPDEIEEREVMIRLRVVGNVKFVGELVNAQVLLSEHASYIIEELKKNTTPTNVNELDMVALSVFLTTIGYLMENNGGPSGKKYLHDIIEWIQTIIKADKLRKQTKFALLDVVDLYEAKAFPQYTNELLLHQAQPDKAQLSELSRQLMEDSSSKQKSGEGKKKAKEQRQKEPEPVEKKKGKGKKQNKQKEEDEDDGWQSVGKLRPEPKQAAPAEPKQAAPKKQQKEQGPKPKAKQAQKAGKKPRQEESEEESDELMGGNTGFDLLMDDDGVSLRKIEEQNRKKRLQAKQREQQRQKQNKTQQQTAIEARVPEKGKKQVDIPVVPEQPIEKAETPAAPKEEKKEEEASASATHPKPAAGAAESEIPAADQVSAEAPVTPSSGFSEIIYREANLPEIYKQRYEAANELKRNLQTLFAKRRSEGASAPPRESAGEAKQPRTFEMQIEQLLGKTCLETPLTVTDAIRIVYICALADSLGHRTTIDVSVADRDSTDGSLRDVESTLMTYDYDINLIRCVGTLFADEANRVRYALDALLSIHFEMLQRHQEFRADQTASEKKSEGKKKKTLASIRRERELTYLRCLSGSLHQLNDAPVGHIALDVKDTLVQYAGDVDAILNLCAPAPKEDKEEKEAQPRPSIPADVSLIQQLPIFPLSDNLITSVRKTPHSLITPQSEINNTAIDSFSELCVSLIGTALVREALTLEEVVDIIGQHGFNFSAKPVLSILRISLDTIEGQNAQIILQPINVSSLRRIKETFAPVPASADASQPRPGVTELLYSLLVAGMKSIGDVYDRVRREAVFESMFVEFLNFIVLHRASLALIRFLTAAQAKSGSSSSSFTLESMQSILSSTKPQDLVKSLCSELKIKDDNGFFLQFFFTALIRVALFASLFSPLTAKNNADFCAQVKRRMEQTLSLLLPHLAFLATQFSRSPSASIPTLLLDILRDYDIFSRLYPDCVSVWDSKKTGVSSPVEIVFRFLDQPASADKQSDLCKQITQVFTFEEFEDALLSDDNLRQDDAKTIRMPVFAFTSQIRRKSEERKIASGDNDWD